MASTGDRTTPDEATDDPAHPQIGPDHLQIGVVAERLGLSSRTLHHWEEVGLVVPSARSVGGFRLYTEQDVDRLLAVRRMKPLGFSLDEMKRLLACLDLLDQPTSSPADIAAAEEFLTECHRRAEQSCTDLEQRLEWAREFSAQLAEHVGADRSS